MEKKVVKSKEGKIFNTELWMDETFDIPVLCIGDYSGSINLPLSDLPALIAALQEIEREVTHG